MPLSPTESVRSHPQFKGLEREYELLLPARVQAGVVLDQVGIFPTLTINS